MPTGASESSLQIQPSGNQPAAIAQLCQGVGGGRKWQTMLGATGTGKTFTAANVIQQLNR